MGRRTLTLFFGSAKTKSKTETTTSLNSWILCLEGYRLTDSSLPLCFKVERISLLKPELLELFLFHLFFKVFRDARKVSSRVSAVGADLWLWLGGRGRPDRRDSHWPGEPVLQSTQSYLWTPGWVQPVSLGAFIQPEKLSLSYLFSWIPSAGWSYSYFISLLLFDEEFRKKNFHSMKPIYYRKKDRHVWGNLSEAFIINLYFVW